MSSDTISGAIGLNRWTKEGERFRYQAYSYSYPHKSAYRPFEKPIPLRDLWCEEKRDSLFLYAHIPFCEMRCGFCNLFTTTNPAAALEKDYLRAMHRQAERVSRALEPFRFSRLAIGGGTPTYLETAELSRLFDMLQECFGVDPSNVPTSIEASPYTLDLEKLRFLKSRSVERISLGIQSFIDAEVRAVGRAQERTAVERALSLIKEIEFPVLNIDLMYGLPGQTEASWAETLTRTEFFEPNQVYLYPLYVRPLTGIGRSGTSVSVETQSSSDNRLSFYRQAQSYFLEMGYTQVSMRMFERKPTGASKSCEHGVDPSERASFDGDVLSSQRDSSARNAGQGEHDSFSRLEGKPSYSCQEDGMVGIGVGARSYTSTCHYSSRYAVGQKAVRQIIDSYVNAQEETFSAADYGIILGADERKRRFVLQSLLQVEGLSFSDYERVFGSDCLEDFPQLISVYERFGLAEVLYDRLVLSSSGLEWSDRIGFELYSPVVRSLMESYETL